MTPKTYLTGGEFLLRPTAPADVFTPEDFDENQRMFAAAVDDFIERHVAPVREDLEYHGNTALGKDLLKQAGELGLLMADIPEAYGGMGSSKATIMLISEKIAGTGSFAVTHGAQAGIGTLPIVYFGTPEQKQEYLPKLATGAKLTCYALTEPGSGSDALAAATTAVLNKAGTHYLLNGTKQYITNAGYAEMVVLFAKVDGEQFTGFIVDLKSKGVTIGAEEKKMGIKGSSTCAIILEDVEVPVGNVLGEIGKGHHIAFNILNVGRFKLGASTVGGCKLALKASVPYTKQRKQFEHADLRLRPDPAQDRRRGGGHLRGRIDGLPHRRPAGRRHRHPGQGRPRLRPQEHPAGRGVQHRVLDDQGLRHRSLCAGRRGVPADAGRLWLLPGVPPGAPLPRRAHQPHLRGHQRDQPHAGTRHDPQEGHEGRTAVPAGGPGGGRAN